MRFDEHNLVPTSGCSRLLLLTVPAAQRPLSPCLVDVSRTLRLSRRERVSKVLVPTLIPSVLLGIRLAAPLAPTFTLLVAIVTAGNGECALLGDA